MNEVWKDIKGYEGLYQVSNTGRVSGPRKILKGSIQNKGFLMVALCKDGIKPNKQFLVHRLVAFAFVDNPNDYYDVDHLNFDKLDNRAENLEWVNDVINNNRLFRAGRMGGNFKSAGRIRCVETGREFKSMKECSDSLGICYASLNYVIHGQMGMTSVNGLHFERLEIPNEIEI
jgi:hypothetical protein